jgi:hypothetical protein
MKLASLLLAGGLSLAAGAALAQPEPGRPDTRTDDQSCSAKLTEAQSSRANANSGAVPVKGPLTPAEQRFLEKCGVAVTVTPEPVAVAVVEPAPVPEPVPAPAPTRMYSSSDYNPGTVVTTSTVTNGPVPDTPENRARFGGPMSRGGQRTAPVGN